MRYRLSEFFRGGHCCIKCPQIFREKTSSQNSQGMGPSIKDVGNFWPFLTPYPPHIDLCRLLNDPSLKKTSSICHFWGHAKVGNLKWNNFWKIFYKIVYMQLVTARFPATSVLPTPSKLPGFYYWCNKFASTNFKLFLELLFTVYYALNNLYFLLINAIFFMKCIVSLHWCF